MAGGCGHNFAQALLDLMFGSTGFTPPDPCYIALLKVAPTDLGGGTEISTGGYARVAVDNDTVTWADADGSNPPVKTNLIEFDFGQASGADWATSPQAGWIAVYDAPTGGNLMGWGPLATPRTILDGDFFKVPVGGASITQA